MDPVFFTQVKAAGSFFVCNGLFAFLRAFDNGFWKIMKGGGGVIPKAYIIWYNQYMTVEC